MSQNIIQGERKQILDGYAQVNIKNLLTQNIDDVKLQIFITYIKSPKHSGILSPLVGVHI